MGWQDLNVGGEAVHWEVLEIASDDRPCTRENGRCGYVFIVWVRKPEGTLERLPSGDFGVITTPQSQG